MKKMNDGTRFDQWQIVLVPFPFTDLSGAKKRPALVVSNAGFNRGHDDLICCLMTSKIVPETGCPIVAAGDLLEGTLPFETKIKPYRLFTIEKTLVIKQLGQLRPNKAEETRKELVGLFQSSD